MSDTQSSSGAIAPLVDHFFRHEASRLVSVLVRAYSLTNLDLAEEVVQSSLLEAMRVWRTRGVPDNPAAWVRRVARNQLLDRLRHEKIVRQHLRSTTEEIDESLSDDAFLDSEIADSQLRMMFVCCDPRLADEDRIALTLKTLCGFGFDEIARALLTNSETIKKRLQRAKAKLAELQISLDLPSTDELDNRLNVVHRILYLLFNEGYLSTSDDRAIRDDLCEEAIRLTTILADHPRYGRPASDALLALMLFHAARRESRLDETGRIILLGDQDRAKWDRSQINIAIQRLDRSARGERISRYHLEAGIAMYHNTAESLATTNWSAIVPLYDALIGAIPSPIFELNRAVAIAERDGPAAGIEAIHLTHLESTLADYHLLDATLGELHRRMGDETKAQAFFTAAIEKTTSPREKELLLAKRDR